MKVLTLLFSGLVATTLARIKKDPVAPGDISTYVPMHPKADNSTYGNIDQIDVNHQHVDWFVNWTSSQLQGSILLDMVVRQNNVMYIQLDSWNNTIDQVNLLPAGSAMRATLGAGNIPVVNNTLVWEVKFPNPVCGDVLVIELPHAYNRNATFSIQVLYQTSPTSEGVTWMTPAQTFGGVLPFMFTYSQDINGRAIAPQMDTPAQRITWGGCITTDSFFQPYMSGNITGVYQSALGYHKTCFYQQIPAPNYLMAAVVGQLSYQSTGENTGILAEPSVLATAAQEFSNL